MLATPIAAAPSTSPWMAMRLRSRQATCSTGAWPMRVRSAQMPTLDMWQLAPDASTALMASTQPSKTAARS